MSLIMTTLMNVAIAQEWEKIPGAELRLKKEEPPKPSVEPTVIMPEIEDPNYYKQGEGNISGAFGILFQLPLDPRFIKGRPGWLVPPKLPSKLSYYGVVKPFTMEAFVLAPPLVPGVLKSKGITFTAYTDFHNQPVWISANVKGKLDEIVPLLTRKYGEPEIDLIEGRSAGYSYYSDGSNLIRVSTKMKSIDYFNLPAFSDYMKQRNRNLRKKFTDEDRSQLTQYEDSLMRIADQIAAKGTSLNSAYGIKFGDRISFLAKPDFPLAFDPPSPLSDLGEGTYTIIVSPDLQPISIRYEVAGSKLELSLYKGLVDRALKLNFGGFLKNTATHSVITVRGRSVSAMVRSGKFSLTFIHSKEQRMMREREKVIEDKIRAAADERKRLEAIEHRKKEIVEEEAF
ncbi:MAG: hypothetical protein ACJAVI_000816 [Candidatus Azotimanducaceae bacterium]|jgi:hypothetical protein